MERNKLSDKTRPATLVSWAPRELGPRSERRARAVHQFLGPPEKLRRVPGGRTWCQVAEPRSGPRAILNHARES